MWSVLNNAVQRDDLISDMIIIAKSHSAACHVLNSTVEDENSDAKNKTKK